MNTITRRNVVTGMAAAGAGTCMCGLAGGCSTLSKRGNTPEIAAGAYAINGKTATLNLDQVPELGQVGGAVKVIDAALPTPIIVARTGATEYAVASLLCPHRGVEVEYRPDDAQFRCASLGSSKFKTDGTFIKGPAGKGLKPYQARISPADETRLVITL